MMRLSLADDLFLFHLILLSGFIKIRLVQCRCLARHILWIQPLHHQIQDSLSLFLAYIPHPSMCKLIAIKGIYLWRKTSNI